ncbi:hypothetical protein F5H01DRAFT_343144 [Linnemannia elongata]|nr:hypothetical protein F5H01DRAFT_343144 [Linnemannia elongata]
MSSLYSKTPIDTMLDTTRHDKTRQDRDTTLKVIPILALLCCPMFTRPRAYSSPHFYEREERPALSLLLNVLDCLSHLLLICSFVNFLRVRSFSSRLAAYEQEELEMEQKWTDADLPMAVDPREPQLGGDLPMV